MADWTTAITIMGSFGAASTAQIISHILTNKREDKKYKKECLQNLYSPVIFKIVEYMSAEQDKERFIKFRRYREIAGEKIYKKEESIPDNIFNYILDFIGKNLKYAQPSLILLYEKAKDWNARLDGEKGAYVLFYMQDSKKKQYREGLLEARFDIRMQICRELLLEFIKISNGLGVLSKTYQKNFQSALFFTELYLLLKGLSLTIFPNELINYKPAIDSMLYKNRSLLDETSNILKEINLVRENSFSKHRNKKAFGNGYHFIYKIADILSEMSGEDARCLREELVKNMRKYVNI